MAVVCCVPGLGLVWLQLPPDGTRSYGIIVTIHQPQQNYLCCLSTQMVSFSRHFCSRRDARVDNLTHANRTIFRKSYKQNSNIFALNKTENIYIR